jgi:hypothetical protein
MCGLVLQIPSGAKGRPLSRSFNVGAEAPTQQSLILEIIPEVGVRARSLVY